MEQCPSLPILTSLQHQRLLSVQRQKVTGQWEPSSETPSTALGQPLGASPPPQKLQPPQHSTPGKSTVAVINIGMWLGMRTAQGQVLLLQMSSVTVKKSQAAYMPSCPLPACFFFFFLAQNPPEVPRSSFSEAQEAGFS